MVFNQLYKQLKTIIDPHSSTDKESVSLRWHLIYFLQHSLINKKILVTENHGYDIRKTTDVKKIMNHEFNTYLVTRIQKDFRYVGNNFVSLREVLINNLLENPENFSNWWELFRFYVVRYLNVEACEVWFQMEKQFGFDVINNLSYNEIKQISSMLIYHVNSMHKVQFNAFNNKEKFVSIDYSKELEYLIRGSHLANILQEKGFTRYRWSGRFYQIRNYDSKEIISIHFHALNTIYRHFRTKIRLMLVEVHMMSNFDQTRLDEDFLPEDKPIFELEAVLFERLKNFHEFYRILDNNSEEEF